MTSPDIVFRQEKNVFRRLALGLTIPCAILPIIVAVSGIMNERVEARTFRPEMIFYFLIYAAYTYGLILSFRKHHRILPLLIFVLHLLSVVSYLCISPAGWIAYSTIFSIILTSVSNQYYRTGSIECQACTPAK